MLEARQFTFIAIDGDDVGRTLERLVLKNDCEGLPVFSEIYSESVRWLTALLVDEYEGTALLSNGDSILVRATRIADNLLARLDVLRLEFAHRSGHTLSVGVGRTMREAYLALKLAKLSGKDQVRSYSDLADEGTQ